MRQQARGVPHGALLPLLLASLILLLIIGQQRGVETWNSLGAAVSPSRCRQVISRSLIPSVPLTSSSQPCLWHRERRHSRPRRELWRSFSATPLPSQDGGVLKEGDYVEVFGMKRLKNWEGKRGRVVGQDAGSTKIMVKFPDEDGALAMKPDILRRVAAETALSNNAAAATTSTASSLDSKVDDEARTRLATDVELQVGDRAEIVGMKRLKKYQGKVGTVEEILDNGRVKLVISGEPEPLMIKTEVLAKVMPPTLPPGTVELEEGVYLLGIAHDDPNSVTSAREIVKSLQPDNVMVELCWERVPLLMDPPMPPGPTTLFKCSDVKFEFLPGPRPASVPTEDVLRSQYTTVAPGRVFRGSEVIEDAKKLAQSRLFRRVIPIFSPPESGTMPSFLPSEPSEQFATQVNPVGPLTWRLETAAVPDDGLQQKIHGLHTYVFRDIAHAVLQKNAEKNGIELPPAMADRPPVEYEEDDVSGEVVTSDGGVGGNANQESEEMSSDELADAVVDPWMQMQKLAQQRAGVVPGEAYRTAMSEALRLGNTKRIVLGDQPQYVTRTRLGEFTSTLSEEEAAQPVVDQIAIATMDVEKKQELMKEYIDNIASGETDVSDEDWEHPILKERDEYMTSVLRSIVAGENDGNVPFVPVFSKPDLPAGITRDGGAEQQDQYSFEFFPSNGFQSSASGAEKTVAIVGANHIPGIRRLWREYRNKERSS